MEMDTWHGASLMAHRVLAPSSRKVVAADGHSYERRAIEQHLEQCPTRDPTSPLTGERLVSAELHPNVVLRSLGDKLQRRLFDKVN